MARIRTIKPEFFRNLKLYNAEVEEKLPLRVAFAGLWTSADREGRFKWIPETLKLDCLPYDDVNFSRVLDALATRGYIIKYSVEGENFGYIPTWKIHQVINNREKTSILPDPNNINNLTREARVPDENSEMKRGKERNMERKGKEGKLLYSEFEENSELLPFYEKTSFEFWKLFKKITIEAKSKPTDLNKANSIEWSKQIRLMIEKQEATKEDLQAVYVWLNGRITEQAKFWAMNIKSTAKLRQQFPKLLELMNNEKIKIDTFPCGIIKRNNPESCSVTDRLKCKLKCDLKVSHSARSKPIRA
jgi:hypothetical protein